MNFTPQPFYPRNEALYQLNRRLGGPQSWSEHFGEETNLFLLLGFKSQIIQPVASHYTDYATLAPMSRKVDL
jgi:hypothetical protein